MLEEQDQTLEVRGVQLAVDAVKRMRHRMRDRLSLEITLQIENVVAQLNDLAMLCLRDSPDEDMNLAWVLGKVGRYFFADEGSGQVGDLKISLDRVVVGNGDEIHPAFAEQAMRFARVAVAVGKIEPAEEPFFRAGAETRMNVKVAAAHNHSLGPVTGPPFRDPVAIGRGAPGFQQSLRQSQNLPPNFRMLAIGRMNTDAGERRGSQLANEALV